MMTERIDAISLEGIKIAIFDFDDTLAIHTSRSYLDDRSFDKDAYYLKAYEHPQDFYETIEPCIENKDMKSLVEYCRSKCIKMFCVSGMRFSLHMPAKLAFIKKHYGNDIELIASAGQERKPDVIRILMRHFNVAMEHVLFVDDIQETINSLRRDTSIIAIHVSEVKNLKTECEDTL